MVEADTVSEAASTTENGTGPPESIGENISMMEEKENGIGEDKKEAKEEGNDGSVEKGEDCEGNVEKGKEIEGQRGNKKMEDQKEEAEKSEEEVNKENEDVKMEGESHVKQVEESKDDGVKDDAGSSNVEEEGDIKDDEVNGDSEKSVEERRNVGMKEESDVKEEEECGDVEKIIEEKSVGMEKGDANEQNELEKSVKKPAMSKEERNLKKRRREQADGKRKEVSVVRGKVKEKDADEGKGSQKKKQVGEDKGAEKKEKKEEKKSEAKKKHIDREKGDSKKVVKENKLKGSSTPVTPALDRPVRERKSVERLVATFEEEPVKEILIPKGRGTALKDIPNVAYKLSKKRSDDAVKLLHAVIYGRRGKASQIKSNVSQFSGFVWHENEEKQQAKIKERLEKYVKSKLIEFCDVLDIPFSKTTLRIRKEDLISKLLEFLMAPHATTDVLLAEKDQPNKANKRKRTENVVAPKSGTTTAKRSARKRRKIGDTLQSQKSAVETYDEDEQGEKSENGVPDGDAKEQSEPSESMEDEIKIKDSEDSGKKQSSSKLPRSFAGGVSVKKARTPKKASRPAAKSSPVKTSSNLSKSKVDDTVDSSPRVFSRKNSRKKNNDEMPEKKPSISSRSTPKVQSGKKVVKEKDKPKKESGPGSEDLRKRICQILKEVDFNTATFTDILKQLASHFKTDLTPRKPAIKLMIHEELSKLAENEESSESSDKDGSPKPARKVRT